MTATSPGWTKPNMGMSSMLEQETKKADVEECPKASHRVGLLINEPPGIAELLFTKSSNDFKSRAYRKLQTEQVGRF